MRRPTFLHLSKIMSADLCMDLAQPFADFEKHNRRLNTSENLAAVNDC